jgi:hypothetical protein
MHSRILMSGVIATFGVTVVCWPKPAITAESYDGQEILVECPNWSWEASQIPGVLYELCFDDIDQCTVADIGDAICTPGLGVHDVWVTAIDYQGADPVYYDGEVASISRVRSADFNGNRVVELRDLFALLDMFGVTGESSEDLDGDGAVGLGDLMIVIGALGNCVSENGQLYAVC